MDYPIILTPDGKPQAVLHHAYNIWVEDELLTTSGGYETLTFNLSNQDRKRVMLNNEQEIELQGRRYVVRVVEDLKNNSNVCTVLCDASWYDLNDGELKHLMHSEELTIDAPTAVAQQLENTGWTAGTVDIEAAFQSRKSKSQETSLYNLRQISKIFGGDLFFDTSAKSVSLLSNMGVYHQKIFCYEKNTTSIKRTVDTRNMFTRVTVIGKDSQGDDVTVEDINDGKDYVENFEWFDKVGLPRKIKWLRKTDDRYSVKENILDYMNSLLAIYSKPSVSYELHVSLFDVSPNLGDYVYVKDSDLGIDGWLRVVSRKKNVLQSHLSTVQLETTKRTIVEALVSNTATSSDVQNTLIEIATPDNEIKLPTGIEDWVMQFKDGEWRATNVIGDINAILDRLNGEVF